MPSYCGKKSKSVKASNKKSYTKSGKLRKSRMAHNRTYCYPSIHASDDVPMDCMVGKSSRCVRKGKDAAHTEKLEQRRERSRQKRKSGQRGGAGKPPTPCTKFARKEDCLPPCGWAEGPKRRYCHGMNLPPGMTYEELLKAQGRSDTGSRSLNVRPEYTTSTESSYDSTSSLTDEKARESNNSTSARFNSSTRQKETAEERRRRTMGNVRSEDYQSTLEKTKGYAGNCEFRTQSEEYCLEDPNCSWTKPHMRGKTRISGQCRKKMGTGADRQHEERCDTIKSADNCNEQPDCHWNNNRCRAYVSGDKYMGPLRQ